jgi:pimeloyl-ACP methyl ester carboxylesterase
MIPSPRQRATLPLGFLTRRRVALCALVIVAGALVIAERALPSIGAGALLHPHRRALSSPAPPGCSDVEFSGDHVRLAGWHCRATAPRRGTLIYLHGVADNRAGAAGMAARFTSRGFDVVAYDSRAHGASAGDVCTYGYYEKRDLSRVIDVVERGPIVLVGASLGAAVALQAAADDLRISAIVAAETFADLRTVASERAPFFFNRRSLASAFALAERVGRFSVHDVNPMRAAQRIAVPVMLIHGERDTDTPPSHSRRVYGALRGKKRLLLVKDAGHNGSLGAAVWPQIERWIDDAL